MADQYKVEAIFSGDTKDLEKNMDGLESKIEESTDKMSGLGDKAKNVAKSIAAAFAVKEVVGFLKGAVEISAELEAMGAQFDQIFTGDNNAKALEQISGASEDLGIHVDRLTDSYNKFGSQTKGAGMDAAASLQATDKATRLAADSAAFFDRSMEDSTAALASFMKGNFEAGDAIGVFTNAKQMDVRANEKYGKSWADLAEDERQWLLLDTVEKTYEMNGAMGQAARESGSYQNVMGNLTAVWDRFKATIGAPILQKIVLPAMKAVIGVVEWLQSAFQSLTSATGPLQGVLASLSGVFASIKAWIEPLIPVIKEGLLMVLGELVALVQANLPTIQAIFQTVFAAIKSAVVVAMTIFTENVLPIWNMILNWVQSNWPLMKEVITEAVNAIKRIVDTVFSWIKSFWDKWGDDVMNNIRNVYDTIRSIITTALSAIKGVLNVVLSALKGDWSGAWEAMKTMLSNVWENIKEVISSAIYAAKNILSDVTEGIRTKISDIWSKVKTKTSETWEAIKKAIMNPINAARDAVKNAIDKIKSFFNFSWKLPELKLPRISVTGSFSLAPPSIPKFGLDWYAQGGIFNGPSVIGVGESGSEAVMPTHKLDAFLRSAVNRVSQTSDVSAGGSVPVTLNVHMGRRVYRTHVEDITKNQDMNLEFNLSYGG